MLCLAGFAALQLFAIVLKRQLHGRTPILPAVLKSPYVQMSLVVVYLGVPGAGQ